MSIHPARPTREDFEALCGGAAVAGASDGELLGRFVADRGPRGALAFEALVIRHGPMVRGVCRRALADAADADDAFQATFLVLVRRAGSVRLDGSLGRWLHGVARRVAARARADRERRRRREVPGVPPERAVGAALDPGRAEALALLDAELARLAEPFRSAIILCDLGGLTHEQAALDLGAPVGTIKSRLARGRAKLRVRLGRRGVDWGAIVAPGCLAGPRPSVPTSLVGSVVRQAAAAVAPAGPTWGAMSPGSMFFREGGSRMIFAMPAKMLAGGALLFALGASGWGLRGRPGDDPSARPPAGNAPPIARTPAPDAPAASPDAPRRRTDVAGPDYVVEPPDIITIEVPRALTGRPITGERPVRPDGKVSLGSYGEVYVAGLTTAEIKDKVVTKLRSFIRDEDLGLRVPTAVEGKFVELTPAQSDRIHVSVASYNSKVYYVQGDVAAPGRFPITGAERVADAIAAAGGIAPPPGSVAHVHLVRPAPPGGCCEQSLPVDFDQVRDRGDQATNYPVRSGDRIVVFREAPEATRGGAGRSTLAPPGVAPAGRAAASAAPARPADDPPGDRSTADPAAIARSNLPREFNRVTLPDYVVQPPDTIAVEVLNTLANRPITGERLVRPDGKVSLGYYGEVYVAGLTTAEIKEKVVLHLRGFLSDEQLGLAAEGDGKPLPVEPARTTCAFVDVRGYNSKYYYVQGDVGTPGRLPITGGETVLDAIQAANGVVKAAGPPRITLVRPAPPGTQAQQTLPVDLGAILEAGDPASNYQMMPGDRLIVRHDPAPRPAAARQEEEAAAGREARLAEVERKLDLILQKLGERGGR